MNVKSWKAPLDLQMTSAGDPQMHVMVDVVFTSDYAQLQAENERLKVRLLSAAGDDLCRLSQEEIKDMSLGVVKIPPKEEFIASCERFHAQVAEESGVMNNCLTLAQLIAENTKLTALVKSLSDRVAAQAELLGRRAEKLS